MLFDERKSMLLLYCKQNSKIFQYDILTEAGISASDYYGFLINRFKAEANACLISGNTIYLQRPLHMKITVIPAKNHYAAQANLTLIFRCEMTLKTARNFFNELFSKITDHINDYGDPQELSSLNDSKFFQLQMFHGLWSSNVMEIRTCNNEGVFLRFDINHKLVCQRSVYDFIKQELHENRHRADCLNAVKESLMGRTVMTRYNNTVCVIDDVDFTSTPSELFEENGMLMSFAEFYRRKYKLDTRHFRQPMLINRIQFTEPTTGQLKSFVKCLIPEFCYPVYTEW